MNKGLFALLRLSPKSIFPPFHLSTISLVPDLRSLWFQGKLLQLTGLMATHQGKTTPRSGAGQEESIPSNCTTCRYTKFNVMGKSLGFTSFEPTGGVNPPLLGSYLT